MDIKEYDWNFVYKIRDSGDVIYKVTIPSERKQDAVEIFKREHPNGLICRGIRSCLLYTSPSPRDRQKSRMPSSA